MRKVSLFKRSVAFVLVLCMVVCSRGISALAEEEWERSMDSQYLSDVKMFYAESEAQARKECEEEGYIFCPQNLIDREEEAGIYGYFGYKTTDDPDKAITDLSLLDMKNSHFQDMTYKEFLDKYVTDFADQASQIMQLVAEMRRQYAAGSPYALMAYDSLNMLYVDDTRSHTDESNLLGYYILNEADVTFFEKYIQRGNEQILSAMVNALCIAVSDFNSDNTTWVDRAKTSSITDLYENANSAEKAQYDTWYRQSAISFIRLLTNFSSTYGEAMQMRETYGDAFGYDELGTDASMEELLSADPNCKVPEYVNAILLYNLLSGIVYQEAGEVVTTDTAILNEGEDAADTALNTTTTFLEQKSLADYFLELAADPELGQYPEKVYPFIEAMTSPQRTAMELCGFGNLIKGLYSADDYEGKRASSIAETERKISNAGYEDGKIWLWEGVDNAIYNLKTVETSDYIEIEKAGTAIIDSVNADARKQASTLTLALQIADISMMTIGGVTMVVQALVGVSLYEAASACFMMSGLAMTAGLTGTGILYAAGGVLAGCLWVLGIVMLVASLAYMVYMILEWCGIFDPVERADYSVIPNIVFHAKQSGAGTYRVRYDAVPSNASAESFMEILQRAGSPVDEGTASVIVDSLSYLRPDVSDLGAFLGITDKWISPFVSRSPAAGQPIVINSEGSFFKLLDNSNTPAGYRPVTLITNSQAADIHSIQFLDGAASKPAYLFYCTDAAAEAADRTAEEDMKIVDDKETPATNTAEAPAGQYITRMRLSHAANREDAMNRLKSGGFLDIIDVNLTPYDGYTFLGFQYGTETNAITDLRVSTIGTSSILYGDSSYAMTGDVGSAMTPDGTAIYATTSKSAGTPITKVAVVNKRIEPGTGAEPVCLFSGGNAVDFKHKWSDNQGQDIVRYRILADREHHFTSQDDTDDGYYIYFWPQEQYKAQSENEPAPYVSGFSYFLSADTGNEEFMQNVAAANGFDLVADENGPVTMMAEGPAVMNPIARWQDVEGGALGHDWRYAVYHFLYEGATYVLSDGAIDDHTGIRKCFENEDFYTQMYFGVSYTFNPYRAITGVAGLITPYTETSSSIRFSGLSTPAGTMQPCTVNIQGNPTTGPGIAYGYFNYSNMRSALFVNQHTTQHSDLPWLGGGDTEVLSRYLLTVGATKGREPIGRDDLLISTDPDPVQPAGYTPVSDLRTPGDTEHPMNFALDTVDLGSRYLYLYLKDNAGGRTGDSGSPHNVYQKKQYVAAVVVGSGKTPEQAIASVYSRMSALWPGLAAQFPDIPETPLVTELDEILPIDIDDETPWYEEYISETEHADPNDDEWIYGNSAANRRWGHNEIGKAHWLTGYNTSDQTPDMAEGTEPCAYIGVIRTGYSTQKAATTVTDDKGKTTTKTSMVYPAYALLKYYTDGSAPESLHVGSVSCQLAGGPVNSKEGRYYLYYSTNSATASFSAPITEIDVSNEAFINGYNTTYSCSENDRTNNALPEFSKLRMRTDEQLYIHTKYTMEDLPYIESLYIGVGKTQEEAYADLIGTTNANGATSINCNYNSFSDTYIALGYRRTAQEKYAIKDMFLYAGDNPLEKINISGYQISTTRKQGNTVQTFKEAKIPYVLLKHNLPSGAEVVSLNEGNEGGPGLYLYYTTTANKIAYEQEASKQMFPIRNMVFSYDDASPEFATADELGRIFAPTLHGQKTFDVIKYSTPVWEYLMGVEGGSPEAYKLDGSASAPMDLNYGIYPTRTGDSFHTGDHRITMYIDRGNSDITPNASQYQPRKNAALHNTGFYADTTIYGVIKQRE